MDHIEHATDHTARPTEVLSNWRENEVIDDHGERVGKVIDVLFDDRVMTPKWAVVHVGLFSADHFVPLDGAYRTQDGKLVIPYHRDFVRHSPKATPDHIMSTGLEDHVKRHYGMAA